MGNGYMKCTDPDNPNKYILLTEGDIKFYEDISGSPTLAAALTQINIYDIAAGGSITSEQRYRGDPDPPQVYVEPKRLRTFDYGGISMDQRIEINDPSVVHSPSTGKCQITVSGGLRAAQGTIVAAAPLAAYRTNTGDTSPAWKIPVSGVVEATAYGYVTNWYSDENSSETSNKYGLTYSLNIGIGTSAGANYWGAGASGSFSDGATHAVQAAVSGASGDYIHISASLSSNGALFSSAGEGYDFGPCFALLGVRCVAGNKILSDNDIFSAVVVGR